jgi:hypothetical protein
MERNAPLNETHIIYFERGTSSSILVQTRSTDLTLDLQNKARGAAFLLQQLISRKMASMMALLIHPAAQDTKNCTEQPAYQSKDGLNGGDSKPPASALRFFPLIGPRGGRRLKI